MERSPQIELIKVSKSFDKGKFDVLEDISLSINRGKFICILGPSGCGKFCQNFFGVITSSPDFGTFG